MSTNSLKEKFAERAGNPAKPYKVLTILEGSRQMIQVKGQNEIKARAAFGKAHPGAQIISITQI